MPLSTAHGRPVLVADIGGTNARFACIDLANDEWLGQWTGPAIQYTNIYTAVQAAQDELPAAADPEAVCIAIAAPVQNDWVRVSNGQWEFSRTELQRRFRWPILTVMNDFHAAAYGVTTLSPGQYLAIGKTTLEHRYLPSAVVGPGTGLGVAGLYPAGSSAGRPEWNAMPTEGGHARFAPFDGEEIELLRVLYRKLGSVQREDILSGRGLCNLYDALAVVRGRHVPAVQAPAVITAEALADPNGWSAEVLRSFCSILGTVSADVALDLGTRGRLFLTGGILPRVSDFLLQSPFRQRFEDHLRFGHYLHDIDTVLVTETGLGLIGAAYWLKKQLASS